MVKRALFVLCTMISAVAWGQLGPTMEADAFAGPHSAEWLILFVLSYMLLLPLYSVLTGWFLADVFYWTAEDRKDLKNDVGVLKRRINKWRKA